MAVAGSSLARFDAVVRPCTGAVATLIGALAFLTRSGKALDIALLGSTVVAFWLWAAIRSIPTAIPLTLATATPIALNIVQVYDEVSMMFLVLTVTYVTLFASERALAWIYAVVVLATITVLSTTGVFDGFGLANWSFGLAFSGAFGAVGHRLRATITELEATRGAMVEQATALERRRIARDVHDLVGHSLAVMMLHLTGARHLLRSDPDEAERALAQAEDAGRGSLAEIRRTIGLLRDATEHVAGKPSPDLTDIEMLVEEFRAAGSTIESASEGPLDAVDVSVGLAAYRIVQESLTNAARHAPRCPISLSIRVDVDTCSLLVYNRTSGVAAAAGSPGFGLIGMRERARSVGGSLIAGPSGTAWTVDASLPVAVAAERVR